MTEIEMRLVIQEGEEGRTDAVAMEVITPDGPKRNAWKFSDNESRDEAIQFACRWAGEVLTK